MQISATQLVGLPVTTSQNRVGTVTKVIFDTATGSVLGLVVIVGKKPLILYKDELGEVGTEIRIRSTDQLKMISKRSLADQAWRAPIHVLGAKAVTEEGQKIGRVIDCTLTLPTLHLLQFIVRDKKGERLIPRDQVKGISDTVVIFTDSITRGHLNWQTKLNPADLSI